MAVSEKTIKRRIKSARNISQITRAMQMVAASKLRRAQERALSGKPYAAEILRLVREAREKVKPDAHPLLRPEGEGKEILVVLVSTNKGLCGSLNSDLFRKVEEWWQKEEKVSFVTLGSKGERFVARTGRNLIADFSQPPFLDSVGAISRMVQEGFLSGTYKLCWVAYTEFISALKDRPARVQLLPFKKQEVVEEKKEEEVPRQELLVEPDYQVVLETLLPHLIEIELRMAIIEAEASEHAARMLAMKNATDSANELIDNLTLVYNKLRQEAVTAEIADMVTARMAVK